MSEQEQYDPFPDENDQAEFETAGLGDTGEVSNEDSDPSEGIPDSSMLEVLARLEAFEARLNSFPLPQPSFPVFVVQNGTGSTWREVVPVNGGLATGGPRSFTGDTVSGAALISLASNQSAVVESQDASTNGNITRFITISGSGSSASSYGRITSVLSTINATTWLYEVTFPSGATENAFNGMEWNGTISSMIQGNPGSLGIAVGSDGSVTGTSCFIKPIGVTGQVPFIYNADTTQWTFALPNSAGS